MRLANNNIQTELLVQISRNNKGRDFFVGDIHGMFNNLMDALKEKEFDFENDRLFSVGDLIDRGPDNEKVLDLLGLPWFYAVRGNHEDMMINHMYQGNIWYMNGGQWAWDDNKTSIRQEVLDSYLTIVENLPIAMEVDTILGSVGVMHTDPPDNWDQLNTHPFREEYIWGRERVRGNQQFHVESIDKVVIGHTPMKKGPWTFGNVINIDAGTFATNIIHVMSVEEIFNYEKVR